MAATIKLIGEAGARLTMEHLDEVDMEHLEDFLDAPWSGDQGEITMADTNVHLLITSLVHATDAEFSMMRDEPITCVNWHAIALVIAGEHVEDLWSGTLLLSGMTFADINQLEEHPLVGAINRELMFKALDLCAEDLDSVIAHVLTMANVSVSFIRCK